MLETAFFVWFSLVTIVTSFLVILLRNPLACACFLILSLVHLAGLYVLLGAHFVAIAQILVYAGAIMVLVIFVIMLLNLGSAQWGFLDRQKTQIPAAVVSLVSLVSLVTVIWKTAQHSGGKAVISLGPDFGSIVAVSRLMFTKYLVPFEIISILLLVATIAAVILAKRVI